MGIPGGGPPIYRRYVHRSVSPLSYTPLTDTRQAAKL